MCISKAVPPAKQENLYYIPPAKQEHLIAVTNRHLFDEAGGQSAFLARLEQVAAARPAALILREKDMEEGDYEVLARKVQILCRRHQVPFIAHTFSGAAKRLHADGLHLPLPLLRTMRQEGRALPGRLGTSCHSLEDVREAEQLGCSYLIAGHIYETTCKPGLPPRGLRFLREAAASTAVPVYAIGGITPERLPEVLAAGAAGGCAMSSLMQGPLWLAAQNNP